MLKRAKHFFFCDADEKMHWTDLAWLSLIGFTILFVVIVTLYV